MPAHVVPSIERAATWHLAGSEALARGTRSLINRAEEEPLKRVERAVGGEEAEAAVFANDDARRPVANLNNVGRAGSGFLNRLDRWSFCLTAARMAAEQERR